MHRIAFNFYKNKLSEILTILIIFDFTVHRVLFAAFAARSAFTASLGDDLQDFSVILTAGDVLRRFVLFIPQTSIAASLQKDSR